MDMLRFSLPMKKRLKPDPWLKPFPVDSIPEPNEKKPFTGFYNGLSVEITDPKSIKQVYSNGYFGLSTKTKNCPTLLYRQQRVRSMRQSLYAQKLQWNSKFINRNPELVMVNLLPPTEDEAKTEQIWSTITENTADIEDTGATTDDATEGNDDEKNEAIDESFDSVKTDDTEENITEDQAMSFVVDENKTEEMLIDEKPELNLIVDPFPIEETLALSLEEAFFLHFSLKCLEIMPYDKKYAYTTEELFDKFSKSNPHFIQQFIVYNFYRSKNWVVRSGLKFGGDFLLYYKGPSYFHASYIVVVRDDDEEMNTLDLHSNYRVSDTTKKGFIIATVIRPTNLDYSQPNECLKRIKEFQVTEIIPKRFRIPHLNGSSEHI